MLYMKLEEMYFTDWYHQFITIEADDLTEQLKDEIKVNEDDCYALCCSYCNQDGLVCFNVLAIGNTWETCTRGLRYKRMLGTFTIDQVADKEARVCEPDYQMAKKNAEFILMMDEDVDEDILETRKDPRLDEVRDIYYPDLVMTGLIQDASITDYLMRITGVDGPFLKGVLVQEPEKEIGVHEGDPVYALLYEANGMTRLFGIFAGSNLDEDAIEAKDKIIQETSKLGLDYYGFSMKS